MKKLLLIIPVILLLTGCAVQATRTIPPCDECNNIYPIRLEEEKVTCYVFAGYKKGGISCLRDKE